MFISIEAIGQDGIRDISYDITVRLDTSDHSLKAVQEMVFVNGSSDKLNEVYFHLWANAYKDNYTPLVQQQLRMNNTSLHFAHKQNKGGYRSIKFSEFDTGASLTVKYEDESEEIAKLELPNSLDPGEEIRIKIEYEIKIPRLYSRFGRRWNYYQITQWYPKLAKYENGIWHTMPYLDIGEFYSDFADYQVDIQVPNNYKIAATGIEDTKHSYTASQVIDFAWFCSPDFNVESKTTTVQGKPVNLEVYNYKNEESKKNAMDYLERSLHFYSEEVGEYPYSKMTLVLSKYAKGGMEYPAITVVGANEEESLDHLIAHEVGHNWFYASLASNEREHAWMDEGLNSFYDHKYHFKHYKDAPYNSLIPEFFRTDGGINILEAGFRTQEILRKSQASNLSSERFSPLNYAVASYQKPAVGYSLLESYVGEDKFRNMVRNYYSTYKNTNVTPVQLQSIFEQSSNLDLSWFFKDFIGSESHVDYGINTISQQENACALVIENKSSIEAPVLISLIDNSIVIDSFWLEGFSGIKKIDLKQCDFDRIALYHGIINPDINDSNNSLKKGGLFKRAKPLDFKFYTGIQSRDRNNLFYLPYASFNAYDKLMLGLGLYNSSYPPKGFRFALAPAYSVNAKQLVGFGLLEKDFIIDSQSLRKAVGSFAFKRYNYFDNGYQLHYTKLTPSVRMYFKTDHLNETSKYLTLRFINLIEEYPIFQEEDIFFDDTYTFISELKYSSLGQDVLAPVKFSASIEYGNYDGFAGSRENYLKVSGEYDYAYQFSKSKFFKFRLFGGYFVMNSQRESASAASRFTKGSFSLMSQGFTDYKYDEVYLGRTNQTGIEARQISLTDGGFKDAPGSAYRIGLSNDYAIALNVKTDFPFNIKLPVKLYFDLGTVSTKSTAVQELKSTAFYSGGIAFELLDETIGIYLPLVQSSVISETYLDRSFLGKISFTFKTTNLNIWNTMEVINL